MAIIVLAVLAVLALEAVVINALLPDQSSSVRSYADCRGSEVDERLYRMHMDRSNDKPRTDDQIISDFAWLSAPVASGQVQPGVVTDLTLTPGCIVVIAVCRGTGQMTTESTAPLNIPADWVAPSLAVTFSEKGRCDGPPRSVFQDRYRPLRWRAWLEGDVTDAKYFVFSTLKSPR